MPWKFNESESLFLQIAKKLRTDIVCGKYKPDEQIPPVRQLAFDAAVNPNTMQKALSMLESEGLLHSKGTVGRFITSDTQIIEKAKKDMKIELARKWMLEADAMGIDAIELIEHINQLKQEGQDI